MTRLVAVTLLAFITLLCGASCANADSVSIDALTTSGQSDMVAGVPRIWTVSGVALVPTKLWIKSRSPGGQPCAPTAATDTGEWYGDWYGRRGWTRVNGTFAVPDAYVWDSPGTYMFCYWLADESTDIVDAITQTIVVRRP